MRFETLQALLCLPGKEAEADRQGVGVLRLSKVGNCSRGLALTGVGFTTFSARTALAVRPERQSVPRQKRACAANRVPVVLPVEYAR